MRSPASGPGRVARAGVVVVRHDQVAADAVVGDIDRRVVLALDDDAAADRDAGDGNGLESAARVGPARPGPLTHVLGILEDSELRGEAVLLTTVSEVLAGSGAIPEASGRPLSAMRSPPCTVSCAALPWPGWHRW